MDPLKMNPATVQNLVNDMELGAEVGLQAGLQGAGMAQTGGIPQNVLQGFEQAGQLFGAQQPALSAEAQLEQANSLARNAFGRIQNPNASFFDRQIAQSEMNLASQIRQRVATEVNPHEARQIYGADMEQQVGFDLAKSRNPFTKSVGDIMGGRADRRFQSIDQQLQSGGRPCWGGFIQILQNDMNKLMGDPTSPTRCGPPAPWSATNQGNGQASIDLGNYTLSMNKANSAWTLTNKETGAVTQVSGDPHVSENGNNWTFKNNTTFQLDDGTKITVKTTPYGNGQTLSNELDITKGNQSMVVTGLAQNSKDPLTISEGFSGRQLAWSNLGDEVLTESGKSWLSPDGQVVNEQYAQQNNL